MNLKSLLVAAFALCSYAGFAQNTSTDPGILPLTTAEPPEMLLIVHVDGKEIEFDAEQKEKLEMESLNPEWITSIQVLSGSEATLHYGPKGRDGVIIIELKDYYLLPPRLQKIVEDGE